LPTDLLFDAWFESHVQPLIDACPIADSHALNSIIELEWARAVGDIIKLEGKTFRINPTVESYALSQLGDRMGRLRVSRHSAEKQAELDRSQKNGDLPDLLREAQRIVNEAITRHYDSWQETSARFSLKLQILQECAVYPSGILHRHRTGIDPENDAWSGIIAELVEDGYLNRAGGRSAFVDYYISDKGRDLIR